MAVIPTVGRVVKARDERHSARLPGFARRVRELRLRAGLTQDQLAERAHLSVSMVQNLERLTHAGNPRLTTLWSLAEALGVDAGELLTEASAPTAKAVRKP